MAVVNYHTVNGRIRGESTAGVRTDYLTDALGSVVATVNSSAQVVNTYRYKPYGERLAKTGVGADPRFGWTGDTGSRRSQRSFADQYNRARHYSESLASWTSIDPLWFRKTKKLGNGVLLRGWPKAPRKGRWMTVHHSWPLVSPFHYCGAAPSSCNDPSGLEPCFNVDKDCAKFGGNFSTAESRATKVCDAFKKCMADPPCRDAIYACMDFADCEHSHADCMLEHCDGTHCVDIWCCKENCCGCDDADGEDPCATTKKGSWLFNCGIRLCPWMGNAGCEWNETFIHELSHCCGSNHDEGDGVHCDSHMLDNCIEQELRRRGLLS